MRYKKRMARPRSANKRTTRFVAPASEQEVADYVKACEATRLDPPATMRQLLAAFAEHVKEHGHIAVPFRFANPDKKPHH